MGNRGIINPQIYANCLAAKIKGDFKAVIYKLLMHLPLPSTRQSLHYMLYESHIDLYSSVGFYAISTSVGSMKKFVAKLYISLKKKNRPDNLQSNMHYFVIMLPF